MDNPNLPSKSSESREKIEADRSEEFEEDPIIIEDDNSVDSKEDKDQSAKTCSIPIPSGSGSTDQFVINNYNSDNSEDDKDQSARNCSRVFQCETSQRRNDQEEQHEVAENNEYRIRLADAVLKDATKWMTDDEDDDDQSHPTEKGEETQASEMLPVPERAAPSVEQREVLPSGSGVDEPQEMELLPERAVPVIDLTETEDDELQVIEVLPVPRNAEPAVDEVLRQNVPEVIAGRVYHVPAHLMQWMDRVYSSSDAATPDDVGTPGREHERERPEVVGGARQNVNRVAAGGRVRKNRRRERRKRGKARHLAALESIRHLLNEEQRRRVGLDPQ